MTRLEDITAAAQAFAGNLTDAQRSVLERLCAAADSDLCARLREGLSPADCYDSFVCAAAWLALSRLEPNRSGGAESFTAGAISVRRGAGTAQNLIARAEAMMRPYLRDSGLDFRRV